MSYARGRNKFKIGTVFFRIPLEISKDRMKSHYIVAVSEYEKEKTVPLLG